MEIIALVGIFLAFSAWREWMFHKSLKEMESQRQKPLEDLSKKMMANNLTDFKFKGTPNDIKENDPNEFDVSEDMDMHLPDNFNINLEDSTGESVVKGKFTN